MKLYKNLGNFRIVSNINILEFRWPKNFHKIFLDQTTDYIRMKSRAKRSPIELCHNLTSTNFSAESWGLTWNAPFQYPIILIDQRHCHSLHIPYIPQWLNPSLAHFYSLGRLKPDCKFTRQRHHSACVALGVPGWMLWL